MTGASPVSVVTRDLVSTIIPVFNRAGQLREAVASVLGQTYRPIEIIVVDDGSTDATGPTLDELARAHPDTIRALHRENAGPGPAREAGRRIARGEFIQHLDSDDLLLPSKFELQVAGLRAHPECGVSYGMTRYHRAGEPRSQTPLKRTGERIPAMFPALLVSRWWDTSTPLYRREVVDRVGPWPDLCINEDWVYDCRVANHCGPLHYVPEFVSEQGAHDGPRLSGGSFRDAAKLRARVAARFLILEEARRAGVEPESPEMQTFSRSAFLLSRQCGAAGLPEESKRLFDLALETAGEASRGGLDFRLYAVAAETLGWSRTGSLACYLDRLRRS